MHTDHLMHEISRLNFIIAERGDHNNFSNSCPFIIFGLYASLAFVEIVSAYIPMVNVSTDYVESSLTGGGKFTGNAVIRK